MNLRTIGSNTLLDDLRDNRVLATNAAIRELACIAHYAELHTVTDETMASTLTERGLDTGLPVAGPSGIAHGTTALNLPDALDLESAVQRRAKLLCQLGDDDTLNVRRAKALGEIAREDLALDLEVLDPDTGQTTRKIPARKTELAFHLSEDGVVARCSNTRTPLTVETVRAWMSNAPGTVIVRPVQDLADCQPVDSYEIPDRLRHQVELARHHCGYPYCTRPAENCDLDHAIPYREAGPTCACNLCPECRGHHRFKTSGQATVRILRPGVYYWTTPSGTYLVDPTGTYPLTSRPGTDQLKPE